MKPQVFGFFSGIGGFELGFERAGFEVKSVCEIDPFCNKVLKKHWLEVPNLGDIRSLLADSRARISRLRDDKLVSGEIKAACTLSIWNSSAFTDLIGLSPKTSDTRGDVGCPNCGASLTALDTPACRFECEPLTWERTTRDRASSLLPTPTASSYGSCRGGGSGRVGKWRKSLVGLGIGHPEDWERLMGFPMGWTDVAPLVTQ